MNKKGIAEERVGKWVLYIIVLVIILSLFGLLYSPLVDEFFMYMGFKTYDESKFEPYVPTITSEEQLVDYSMKALTCSLNSVAIGKFKPTDTGICPEGGVILEQSPIPTGAFITGKAVQGKEVIQYGNSIVTCSGHTPNTVQISDVHSDSVGQVTEAIINCWQAGKDASDRIRCSYLDTEKMTASISKEELITSLKEFRDQNEAYEDDVDDIVGDRGGLWGIFNPENLDIVDNKISKTTDNAMCIEYENGIKITYCGKPISNTLSCEVKNFELPQDVSKGTASIFLKAFGDPRWLVYYESFPPEATAFWHKEWSDLFGVYSIGMITASGVISAATGGLGRVGTKATVKGATSTSKKLMAEEAEQLAKKLVKEGTENLLVRFSRYGTKNGMRSILLDEGIGAIEGITKEQAEQISEAIVRSMGKKYGSRAFNKVSANLEKEIAEIVGGDAQLAKKILAESGAESIFTRELSKEAAEKIIKNRAYSSFFINFLKADGTLDEVLLRETAEKGLRYLIAVGKVEPTFIEAVLKKPTGILDELISGSVGYTREDLRLLAQEKGTARALWSFLAEQSPIALPKSRWLLSGPGYAVATIGRTTMNLPSWVINHRYPLLLITAILIEAEDSINEKFKPVGTNAIAINQPTLYGPTKPYTLTQQAEKYFIRNSVKPGSRLYFASPCKANLVVQKTKCTCNNDPLSYRYDFGGGIVNVEPGTIEEIGDIEIEDDVKNDFNRYVVKSNTPNDKSFYQSMTEYYDTSTAIKQCYDRSTSESIFDYGKSIYHRTIGSDEEWNNLQSKSITYTSDCIEVTPTRLEGTYCYDHFPTTGWIRDIVFVGTLVVDSVIMGSTSGLALPVAMFTSGVISMGTDLALEKSEKWP